MRIFSNRLLETLKVLLMVFAFLFIVTGGLVLIAKFHILFVVIRVVLTIVALILIGLMVGSFVFWLFIEPFIISKKHKK